jgi:hypothetical protein
VLHHESLKNGNPTSFFFYFEGTKILAQKSNTQRRKLPEAAQIWLHNDCAIYIKIQKFEKTYLLTVKKFEKEIIITKFTLLYKQLEIQKYKVH